MELELLLKIAVMLSSKMANCASSHSRRLLKFQSQRKCKPKRIRWLSTIMLVTTLLQALVRLFVTRMPLWLQTKTWLLSSLHTGLAFFLSLMTLKKDRLSMSSCAISCLENQSSSSQEIQQPLQFNLLRSLVKPSKRNISPKTLTSRTSRSRQFSICWIMLQHQFQMPSKMPAKISLLLRLGLELSRLPLLEHWFNEIFKHSWTEKHQEWWRIWKLMLIKIDN